MKKITTFIIGVLLIVACTSSTKSEDKTVLNTPLVIARDGACTLYFMTYKGSHVYWSVCESTYGYHTSSVAIR